MLLLHSSQIGCLLWLRIIIRFCHVGRDLLAAHNCANVLHPDGVGKLVSASDDGQQMYPSKVKMFLERVFAVYGLVCGCFDGFRVYALCNVCVQG